MSIINIDNNTQQQPFLNRSTERFLGPSISSQWTEQITSTALSALTYPANCQTIFPLKYYYTSYFTNTTLSTFNNLNLIKLEQQPASAVDELIYHALLYFVGKGFGLIFWAETDIILTLLSSPPFVAYTCQQSWFKQIKSDLIKFIGDQTFRKILVQVAKRQSKQYIEENLVRPLQQILNPKEVYKNLENSFRESFEAKYERAQLILEDSKETIDQVKAEGINRSTIHQTMSLTTRTLDELSIQKSLSELRVLPKQHLMLPLPTRLTAAWGIFGSICPPITSLSLIHPETNAGELLIRVSAVGLSVITDRPLMCTVAAECIIALSKRKLKALSNQKGSDYLQQVLTQFREVARIPLADAKDILLEQGFRLKDIQTIGEISSQVFGAAAYACLNLQTHPFISSLSASSFIQYLGVIGENFGIVEAKNFASTEGYLSSLPFQILVGATLTGLELVYGTDYRPFIAIRAVLFTMPIISDKVVSSKFYRKYVTEKLEQLIFPNLKNLKTVSFYDKIISKGVAIIPKNLKNLGRLSYLERLSQMAKYALITQSIYHIASHSVTKKAGEILKVSAIKAMAIYGKYVCLTTIESYLGSTAGTLAALADLPKDKTTWVVATASLATSLITQSPVLTSAITVLANDCMRTSFVQETAHKAKEAVQTKTQKLLESTQAIWTNTARFFKKS